MASKLKKLFHFSGVLIALPFYVLYLISGKNNSVFIGIGQLLSLIPDKIGSFIRVGFYRLTLSRCDSSAYIGFGTYFSKPATEIGKKVYISTNCLIANVVINDNVAIAPGVQILSGRRQHYITEVGVPAFQQKSGVYQQISIGANSWIGQNAIVMANIGKQNMIGAGSVVVKDTGDFEVLAGNPARVIKKIA